MAVVLRKKEAIGELGGGTKGGPLAFSSRKNDLQTRYKLILFTSQGTSTFEV